MQIEKNIPLPLRKSARIESAQKRDEEIKAVFNMAVSTEKKPVSISFETDNIKSWKTFFYTYRRENDPNRTTLFTFVKVENGKYRVWRKN